MMIHSYFTHTKRNGRGTVRTGPSSIAVPGHKRVAGWEIEQQDTNQQLYGILQVARQGVNH